MIVSCQNYTIFPLVLSTFLLISLKVVKKKDWIILSKYIDILYYQVYNKSVRNKQGGLKKMNRLTFDDLQIGETYDGTDSAGNECSICIVGFSAGGVKFRYTGFTTVYRLTIGDFCSRFGE